MPATRCSIEDSGADDGFGNGDLDLVCKFAKKNVDLPAAGADCRFVPLTAATFGGVDIFSGDIYCLSGEATCNSSTPVVFP